MPRIIHAADIHLDSPLQGLGRLGDAGLATELRAATRGAYTNLVKLCVDEKARLLVIAGDVYDGDWRSYETGEFFVSGLQELRDHKVEVVLVYGNHDAESSITKRLTMPDGVRVLRTSEPESVEFPDIGIAVHGQGYAVRDVWENLAQHYPRRRDGWANVGVLHTGIEGVAGHAKYAPCKISDLTACEYEYFALGHVHQRSEKASGATTVWFSGNLQGRHPRESGPKGALVVDLEPDTPAKVRFAECDVARWEVLKPDLSECEDVDDVVAVMASAYQTALGQAGDRPLVVRYQLSGPTVAAGALSRDPDRLVAEARSIMRTGSAVEKVVLDVSPPVSSSVIDPELAAQITEAAQALAGDPAKVRALLDELHKFGIWRQTKGTDMDFDIDEVLASLVQRATRRLTSNLEN